MNNEEAKEFYKNMTSKFGTEKTHSMLDSIFDFICMTGDKKALSMKNCADIKEMMQNEIDKYLIPNLDNEEIVEKFYKFTSALKEQTNQLIKDFEKEMEM